MRKQQEATKFKASAPRVLEQKPFVPQKVLKPLTEFSNFTHHLDLRARERDTFEQKKKQREAEIEANKRQVCICQRQ
jgi:hypothetical protein